MMNHRIEQLDSLRGLAAFAVVLSHIPYFAFSLPYIVNQAIAWSGLNDGHYAVMLFFLLSGFVLSIPFLKIGKLHYVPYVIKRFFRIYIPYFVAILFAMILSQLFLGKEVRVIGEWNLLWNQAMSLPLFTDHVLFLGNYHTNAFNGVIWSLIHELRISLIFPFIALFIIRYNWKVTLVVAVLLSCISELNTVYSFQESVGYHTDYFQTLHYTSFFMFGSLIAKHKQALTEAFRERPLLFKSIFLGVSFFLFKFSNFSLHFLYDITGIPFLTIHFNALAEYGTVLGCVGIVISAISSVRLEKVLLMKPFLFLGKISYSLYLLHLPVILCCVYLFQDVLPLWSIALAAIASSLGIATIAWLAVEIPSQKAGRDIARRVQKKQVVFSPKKKAL